MNAGLIGCMVLEDLIAISCSATVADIDHPSLCATIAWEAAVPGFMSDPVFCSDRPPQQEPVRVTRPRGGSEFWCPAVCCGFLSGACRNVIEPARDGSATSRRAQGADVLALSVHGIGCEAVAKVPDAGTVRTWCRLHQGDDPEGGTRLGSMAPLNASTAGISALPALSNGAAFGDLSPGRLVRDGQEGSATPCGIVDGICTPLVASISRITNPPVDPTHATNNCMIALLATLGGLQSPCPYLASVAVDWHDIPLASPDRLAASRGVPSNIAAVDY